MAWLIGNVGQRWLQQRIQQQGFSPPTYDLVRYGHGAELVFGARVAFVFGIAVLVVPELLAACADFGLPPEIRQEVSVVPNRRSKGLDILAAVACKRNRSGLGDQDWDEFQLYGSTPGPYPPKEDGSCRELDVETSSWNGVKAFPTVGSVRLSFIVASSFSESRKRMAGEELSLFPAHLNVKVVPERFVHSVRLTNKLIVVSIICVL